MIRKLASLRDGEIGVVEWIDHEAGVVEMSESRRSAPPCCIRGSCFVPECGWLIARILPPSTFHANPAAISTGA